jgi:hypothetical protein
MMLWVTPARRLIEHQRYHIASRALPAGRLQLETALQGAYKVVGLT